MTVDMQQFPADPFAPCDACDAESVPLTRIRSPRFIFPIEVCDDCKPAAIVEATI